jgi:hypothetical protein
MEPRKMKLVIPMPDFTFNQLKKLHVSLKSCACSNALMKNVFSFTTYISSDELLL